MQKVIGGKRYNTNTATKVAEDEKLTLYRKVTGEYFSVSDNTINRLSFDEAKNIGKKMLDKKEYIYTFEVKEEKTTGFTLNLPASLREKLQLIANEKGITPSEVAIDILFDQLF